MSVTDLDESKTELAVTVACQQCLARYRVRRPDRLTTASRSTCSACGTPFAVAAILSQHSALQAVDEHSTAGVQSTGAETPAASAQLRGAFHGEGGTLFGMQVVNICLSIVTLGTYHFWGKAKIRRYLFSQTSFAGDRFVYHGTGKELYQGFLKAMLVFGLPYGALSAAQAFLTLPRWADVLVQVSAALVLVLYVPIAIVNARRYRCTRSSWRGIRFSFHGRTLDFLKLYFKGWALTLLTLGTYYPYFHTQRQAFLHAHTRFGNQRFRFTGHGSGLMGPFAVALCLTYVVLALCGAAVAFQLSNAVLAWLLIPFVLGPVWVWMLAKKQVYYWEQTWFGPARFSSTVTWQTMVPLYLGNALLLVLTLGFAWPWVTVRNARYFTQALSLNGTAELDRVQQDITDASLTGEGLSNLLDTGFDMD